jgi:lipopolysaccharide/colanic/teichoic acid biosynthesis glycosyltransferase
MYIFFFKRVIDFVLSLIAFVCISPLFILIWLCLLFANKKSGAFFFQLRPGKNEKIFKVIKFKTMNDCRDEYGQLRRDSLRLTKIGAYIRSTSLDEIPQLLNVMKGDMSLVGPRPLLVKYLPYYTEKEKLRHSVRPGITGLAQINGRNTLNWNDRLNYDIEYVENMSIILDIRILYLTALKVIKSENIVIDPESIMKNLDDERKRNISES